MKSEESLLVARGIARDELLKFRYFCGENGITMSEAIRRFVTKTVASSGTVLKTMEPNTDKAKTGR